MRILIVVESNMRDSSPKAGNGKLICLCVSHLPSTIMTTSLYRSLDTMELGIAIVMDSRGYGGVEKSTNIQSLSVIGKHSKTKNILKFKGKFPKTTPNRDNFRACGELIQMSFTRKSYFLIFQKASSHL